MIASVSSKDFPDKKSKAWPDIANSRQVAPQKPAFSGFPESVQQQILSWSDNGYMVLEKLFSQEDCDKINEEIDVLLRRGS